MKRILTILMVLVLFLAPVSTISAKTDKKVTEAFKVAGLLYGHLGKESHVLCTTFTFAHEGNKYELGTASHCVSGSDLPPGLQFSVIFDETTKKEYPAKVMAVGGVDSEAGDAAVLEIETTDNLPVAALSYDEIQPGDLTYYVGGADALGKQFYRGMVSESKLNLPKAEGGNGAPLGWNDVFLMQSAGGPGASGSGVRSAKTGQFIGILVGHPSDGEGIIVVVRIEQLRALWLGCNAGQKLPGGTCGPVLTNLPLTNNSTNHIADIKRTLGI